MTKQRRTSCFQLFFSVTASGKSAKNCGVFAGTPSEITVPACCSQTVCRVEMFRMAASGEFEPTY